jgi:hypothetical protein
MVNSERQVWEGVEIETGFVALSLSVNWLIIKTVSPDIFYP